MRLKVKPTPDASKEQLGQERIVRRFLLWPMKIGDEWRWLESVSYIEQAQLIQVWSGAFDGPEIIWRDTYKWVPQEWSASTAGTEDGNLPRYINVSK